MHILHRKCRKVYKHLEPIHDLPRCYQYPHGGRPNTETSSMNGIASSKVVGGSYVSAMYDHPKIHVDHKLHAEARLRTRTSSFRLWIVLLIPRRRCERRLLKVSGTTVRHL